MMISGGEGLCGGWQSPSRGGEKGLLPGTAVGSREPSPTASLTGLLAVSDSWGLSGRFALPVRPEVLAIPMIPLSEAPPPVPAKSAASGGGP